jgi:glycosyltransferase involved in cell wall biosynthesis
MRIAFDGTTLRPGRTGVGYYTEHLLHHLAEQRSRCDELIVLSNRDVEISNPLPATVRVPRPGFSAPRMLWMQSEAIRLLREFRPEVAHFTNGMIPLWSPVPTVVTIHDTSLTMYPRFHPARRVLLNRPLMYLAARQADAVITVSESAKRDITRVYRLPAERVHVVHEAAAPCFRPVTDAREHSRVRQAYGLGDRIILYVGTIEPRKNLPLLIEAFANRRRAGDLRHQLVCAGPYGWLCRDIARRVEELGICDAVRFTGYVPVSDLPVLYTLAEMFVFPSLYEGFGLPVIEAMACGTPVITGPVPALAEVTGGAVAQVPDLHADALGELIVRLSRDESQRAALRASGFQRAAGFSWDRAARETFGVYEQVVKTPTRERAVMDARVDRELETRAPVPVTSHAASRESEESWVR